MPHPKLLANHEIIAILADAIGARALRSDYFHSGKLRQAGRYLVLHADREVSVLAIWTEIFKRQDRDRALHFGGGLGLAVQPRGDSCRHHCQAEPCRSKRKPLPPGARFGVETDEAAMNR